MPIGKFITFEGGEGAGKTTQIHRLAEWLSGKGVDVTVTREPGGTPNAEAIRDLVLTGDKDRFDPITEMLLFMAARQDHVARRIKPALHAGAWVLCDRFIDSTRVYQGLAIGVRAIDRVYETVFGKFAPDMTILLDISPQAGLARRRRAGDENRFEARDMEFHRKVRQGFLALASDNPSRFLTVDAEDDEKSVADAVVSAVEDRFFGREQDAGALKAG